MPPMNLSLEAKIEAILFQQAEPFAVEKLAKATGTTSEEVSQALERLEQTFGGRGTTLIRKNNEVMLGTTSEAGELLGQLAKEELSADLGKAGLETLSIVLYRGPITRAEIDWIRGVNSSFILRHLLVRGLVEKIPNPENSRSLLYRPTFEVMSLLGISKIGDLPDYQAITTKLNEVKNAENQ